MGQLLMFPKKPPSSKNVQYSANKNSKKKKPIATMPQRGTLLFFTGTRYHRYDKALPGN